VIIASEDVLLEHLPGTPSSSVRRVERLGETLMDRSFGFENIFFPPLQDAEVTPQLLAKRMLEIAENEIHRAADAQAHYGLAVMETIMTDASEQSQIFLMVLTSAKLRQALDSLDRSRTQALEAHIAELESNARHNVAVTLVSDTADLFETPTHESGITLERIAD
jgi:hypothetical protein